MRRVSTLVAMTIALIGISALAPGKAEDIRKGTPEARLDALAAIQPGMGTVMKEYGDRFVDLYFAAKGGNWGMAQYQLKEAREIQEIGEITRPARAAPLKAFESAYIEPLEEAIQEKDFSSFGERYQDTIKACNGCHEASGVGFVRFILPDNPAAPHLDFAHKTDPK